MWYFLMVIFLLISLFVGYRMTLSMDRYLDAQVERSEGKSKK